MALEEWRPYTVSLWKFRVRLIDGSVRYCGSQLLRRRTDSGFEYKDQTAEMADDDVFDRAW